MGLVQYNHAMLVRRAKIELKIHHFSMPYFEWWPMMHYGLMQGNCIVTETLPKVPGLQPGVHYLEADKYKIPDLIDWLLSSSDGIQTLNHV